VTLIGDPAI
jgi:hypothetical protein